MNWQVGLTKQCSLKGRLAYKIYETWSGIDEIERLRRRLLLSKLDLANDLVWAFAFGEQDEPEPFKLKEQGTVDDHGDTKHYAEDALRAALLDSLSCARISRLGNSGFLVFPCTNSGWLTEDWNNSCRFIFYGSLNVYLSGNLLQVELNDFTPLPCLSRITDSYHNILPGSPIQLMPHNTPAYFLTFYKGSDAALQALHGRFQNSLAGLGCRDWECYSKKYILACIILSDPSSTETKTTTLIYPLALVLLVDTSLRSPLNDNEIPKLPCQLEASPPLPSSKHPPPSLFFSQQSLSNFEQDVLSHHDISAVPLSYGTFIPLSLSKTALEISGYVDFVAKEREREKQQRVSMTRIPSNSRLFSSSSESKQPQPILPPPPQQQSLIHKVLPPPEENPLAPSYYPSPQSIGDPRSPLAQQQQQQSTSNMIYSPTLPPQPMEGVTVDPLNNPFLEDDWMNNVGMGMDMGMDLDFLGGPHPPPQHIPTSSSSFPGEQPQQSPTSAQFPLSATSATTTHSSASAYPIFNEEPQQVQGGGPIVNLQDLDLTDDDFNFFDVATTAPPTTTAGAVPILPLPSSSSSSSSSYPAGGGSSTVWNSGTGTGFTPPPQLGDMGDHQRQQGGFGELDAGGGGDMFLSGVGVGSAEEEHPLPPPTPASPRDIAEEVSHDQTIPNTTPFGLPLVPISSRDGETGTHKKTTRTQFEPLQFSPSLIVLDEKYSIGKFGGARCYVGTNETTNSATTATATTASNAASMREDGWKRVYDARTDPRIGMVKMLRGRYRRSRGRVDEDKEAEEKKRGKEEEEEWRMPVSDVLDDDDEEEDEEDDDDDEDEDDDDDDDDDEDGFESMKGWSPDVGTVQDDGEGIETPDTTPGSSGSAPAFDSVQSRPTLPQRRRQPPPHSMGTHQRRLGLVEGAIPRYMPPGPGFLDVQFDFGKLVSLVMGESSLLPSPSTYDVPHLHPPPPPPPPPPPILGKEQQQLEQRMQQQMQQMQQERPTVVLGIPTPMSPPDLPPSPFLTIGDMREGKKERKEVERWGKMLVREVLEGWEGFGKVWLSSWSLTRSNEGGGEDEEVEGDETAELEGRVERWKNICQGMDVGDVDVGFLKSAFQGVGDLFGQEHQPQPTTMLKPLAPPTIVLSKAFQLIDLLHTSLRFWNKSQLGPKYGRKHGNLVGVVYGSSPSDDEENVIMMKIWLQGLVGAYQTNHFGTLTPGGVGEGKIKQEGIALIDGITHFGSFFNSIQQDSPRNHQHHRTNNNTPTRLPIILIIFIHHTQFNHTSTSSSSSSSSSPSTSSPLIRSLLLLFHSISSTMDHRTQQIIPYILPSHKLAQPPLSSASPPLAILSSIYNRILLPVRRRVSQRQMFRHSMREELKWMKGFHCVLPVGWDRGGGGGGGVDDDVNVVEKRRKVEFERRDKASLGVLDKGMMVHVGYRIVCTAADSGGGVRRRRGRKRKRRKWLTSYAIDERGENSEIGVWLMPCFDDDESGVVVEGENENVWVVRTVWDFMVRFVKDTDVEWRVVFGKMGWVGKDEVDAWVMHLKSAMITTPGFLNVQVSLVEVAVKKTWIFPGEKRDEMDVDVPPPLALRSSSHHHQPQPQGLHRQKLFVDVSSTAYILKHDVPNRPLKPPSRIIEDLSESVISPRRRGRRKMEEEEEDDPDDDDDVSTTPLCGVSLIQRPSSSSSAEPWTTSSTTGTGTGPGTSTGTSMELAIHVLHIHGHPQSTFSSAPPPPPPPPLQIPLEGVEGWTESIARNFYALSVLTDARMSGVERECDGVKGLPIHLASLIVMGKVLEGV